MEISICKSAGLRSFMRGCQGWTLRALFVSTADIPFHEQSPAIHLRHQNEPTATFTKITVVYTRHSQFFRSNFTPWPDTEPLQPHARWRSVKPHRSLILPEFPSTT